MGILSGILRALTWSDGTLNFRLWSWRKGSRVGQDAQGNTFFQSAAGRRWVLYNGEAEASRVGAEWHGWLHHTFDQPPTAQPRPHKPWEKPHLPNLTGTALAYAPPGSIRHTDPVARSDYEAWRPE